MMGGNFCYIVVPGNPPSSAVGAVIYMESGYNATTYEHCQTLEECRSLVAHINERLGVPPEVEQAMLAGSMFGWHVPGATAAHRHWKEHAA